MDSHASGSLSVVGVLGSVSSIPSGGASVVVGTATTVVTMSLTTSGNYVPVLSTSCVVCCSVFGIDSMVMASCSCWTVTAVATVSVRGHSWVAGEVGVSVDSGVSLPLVSV